MTTPDAEDEDLVTEYRDAVRVHDRTPDKYNLNQMDDARAALLAHLSRQRAALAEARAEIATLLARAKRADGGLRDWISANAPGGWVDALRAQLEASSRKAEGLREALRKYGMHAQGCSSWQRYHKAEEACSCGLTSALASTGDAGREQT